jgi:hypothetical protein
VRRAYRVGLVQAQGSEIEARSLTDSAWVFASLALVAASLTVVFLGMRSVMEIGGACAQGGPFVPVRPCPAGVPGLMVGGIWLGLISAGVYVWRASRARALSFVGFFWPALFLSLGWNFWEFGLEPPDAVGTAWGWIVCAVVFFVMGAAPLLVAVPWFVRRLRGQEPTVPDLRARFATRRSAPVSADREPGSGADLVTRLERLDALHRSGALDDREYEAAKTAVLGGGETP